MLFAAPVYAQEGHSLGFMDFGAHIQAGLYPNDHGARGAQGNGDLGFMTNPDFNVNQAWIWLGKDARTETNDFDFGFRLDAFYGTDAFFASANNSDYLRQDGSVKKYWDSNFFRGGYPSPGIYGLALPQTYIEIAYYKWKLTAGRFFSFVGYESVDATQNNFYSKTFYTLSLPSSATGSMLQKSFGPFDFTAAAYSGLDSGFDNPYKDYFFSGAANINTGKNTTISYSFIGGRYGGNTDGGARIFVPAGAFVYFHNLLFQFMPAKNLRLVTEAYYNQDNHSPSGGLPVNNIYGATEYAVYKINQAFSGGLRAEWTAYYHENKNSYAATANITYKPAEWFYVRPEARYSWGTFPAYNGGKDTAQFNFGMEITAIF